VFICFILSIAAFNVVFAVLSVVVAVAVIVAVLVLAAATFVVRDVSWLLSHDTSSFVTVVNTFDIFKAFTRLLESKAVCISATRVMKLSQDVGLL